MTTRYARQYAAAVRRYAAPRDGVRAFVEGVEASKTGPHEGLRFGENGGASRNAAVATHLRVFADYLADHDDPREALVRQHADSIEQPRGMRRSTTRVLGSPHRYVAVPADVSLPDGTSLYVYPLLPDTQESYGPAPAADVVWRIPHDAGNEPYRGYFPATEAVALVHRLAPEHADRVADHLTNWHRRDAADLYPGAGG